MASNGIYIEYLKEIAKGMSSLKLTMGLKYVDDAFILWSHQDVISTAVPCRLNKNLL